ncbi:MAG: hypothetical protein ACK5H2_02235 [Beutenbergiaceae bacterium]
MWGTHGLWTSLIGPGIIIVALLVVGGAGSRRVGPGRGRMWAGISLLVFASLVSALANLVFAYLMYNGFWQLQVFVSIAIWVLTSIGTVGGVALLVSAAVRARTGSQPPFPASYGSATGGSPSAVGGYSAPDSYPTGVAPQPPEGVGSNQPPTSSDPGTPFTPPGP